MQKAFLQLTDEAKASVKALWGEYLKAEAVDGGDYGTFEVIATTEDVDRDGEVILADGWDFENFKANPVALWGHDFYSMPVGKITEIVRDDKKIIARGVFAPTERGQEVRKAWEGEFLNTVSVGFIPRERSGKTITKAELLEISFVPVPANPQAVAMRSAVEALAQKMMGKPEEKGEVGEIVDEQAIMDEKWSKMDGVSRVVGALWEAYMKPETKVEDFDALLNEAIVLLQGLVAGTPVEGEGAVATGSKNIDGKLIGKAFADALDVKIGRVLSAKNAELIGTCVEQMNTAVKSLKDLLDASTTEDEKALDPTDQPVEEGVEASEKATREYREMVAQATLKALDKAVGLALREINLGKAKK